MKTPTLLTGATLIVGSLITATAQTEPKAEVQSAIKMLTEKANYSWTSTTKRPERPDAAGGANNRFQSGPITGKTSDGFVLMKSTFGDRASESLRKGDKVAIKRDGAWTVREPRGENGNNAGQDGDRRGRTRGGFGRTPTLPDAQAAEILAMVAELKKDGDNYAGSLTEEGAQSLVSFGRGRRGGDENADRPQPKGVAGSAKFWITDGVLVKYETSVTGSITFNDTERDLSRTTTVEITEIGATKLDVPEETIKKLEATEDAPAEPESKDDPK